MCEYVILTLSYNWVFTFSTQSQLCRKNIPLKVYLRILKPARMPQNLLLLSNSARNISARIKWDSLKFQNYFSNQSMFWKAHIHTPVKQNFFSYSWKVLFCQMERSGVVCWLRIEITVVFDSSFQNIHYRIETLPLARWMRMQQTIYLSYRGSRVPGEGKWGPRGTRITDGASLDPLLATQVVCTYYRWCKMLLTRCGCWYVIICGASSGIE